MESFVDILFSQVNATLTVFMILLVVYWLLTMISGIDFDWDVEIDVDAGVDGRADFHDMANAELNKEDVVGERIKPLKWWQVFLIYFNFVGLPFMFTLTCFVFIWWFSTVLATALTASYDNIFGFVLLIVAFFTSLVFTKIFTTPFKGFFKYLNKDGDRANDFVGRRGVLLSSISGNKMGSAEITINGDTMSVYVKSIDGKPLGYLDEILVIKQSADKNYFLVQLYNE